ncbi:hypothetical protein ACFWU3_16195 [Streptomyces sp. NPDC058685]|uniref:hypothetical protein n=1 Tax=Streptomyces sp. NPDC058685 TaxID=3346598 RepID=UPI003663066E
MSVTLGAAGFAAANIATSAGGKAESGLLPWILWVGALLAMLVVYAGTVTGVFALPAGIPSVWDLAVPLAIGLAQFMLFGALTRSVAQFATPDGMVRAWFFAMAAVGAFATIGILRARRLVKVAAYDVALTAGMKYYRSRLVTDAVGAGVLTLVGAVGGALRVAGADVSPFWTYVNVSTVLLVLIMGLIMHHTTGRELRRRISEA